MRTFGGRLVTVGEVISADARLSRIPGAIVVAEGEEMVGFTPESKLPSTFPSKLSDKTVDCVGVGEIGVMIAPLVPKKLETKPPSRFPGSELAPVNGSGAVLVKAGMIGVIDGAEGPSPNPLMRSPSRPPPKEALEGVEVTNDATGTVENVGIDVIPATLKRSPRAPSIPPRDVTLVREDTMLEIPPAVNDGIAVIGVTERHEGPGHSVVSSPKLASTPTNGEEPVAEQVGQRPSRIPTFKEISMRGCCDLLDVISVVGGGDIAGGGVSGNVCD